MKRSLLMIVLCAGAFLAKAQQVIPGIKAGLNGSDITTFNGDNRISGQVGFFARIRLTPKWHLQPELLYSGEGQRFIYARNEYTRALDYLRIPLMFQYSPIRPLYFEFGPQLGYLLSAHDKGPGGYKADTYDAFHKADMGLNLGMGVNANEQIGFYFRYYIGLTDITAGDNYSNYNRVAQLGVSLKFR